MSKPDKKSTIDMIADDLRCGISRLHENLLKDMSYVGYQHEIKNPIFEQVELPSYRVLRNLTHIVEPDIRIRVWQIQGDSL